MFLHEPMQLSDVNIEWYSVALSSAPRPFCFSFGLDVRAAVMDSYEVRMRVSISLELCCILYMESVMREPS